MRVLFVCTMNKLRSRTAHDMYSGHPVHEIRSAGVDVEAVVQVTRELLEWADKVFVFEKMHRNKIRKMFPDIYQTKSIECLYIADDYEYMHPVLVGLIEERLTAKLGLPVRFSPRQ